jgi:hypothetical protein
MSHCSEICFGFGLMFGQHCIQIMHVASSLCAPSHWLLQKYAYHQRPPHSLNWG